MKRVDEIRARLAAITPTTVAPRPWRRDAGYDGWRRVGPAWVGLIDESAKATADFIAQAPEDVAYLLAEVERLQASRRLLHQLDSILPIDPEKERLVDAYVAQHRHTTTRLYTQTELDEAVAAARRLPSKPEES